MALGTCLKNCIFISYQPFGKMSLIVPCKWWCGGVVSLPLHHYWCMSVTGIFFFYLHFSSIDLHKAWITHDVLNLQLSLAAYWRLKYAEFYCLLFIDFKLERVMLHRLGACTHSHRHTQGPECLMIYSKSCAALPLWGDGGGVIYVSTGFHLTHLSLNFNKHSQKGFVNTAVW